MNEKEKHRQAAR